VLVSRPRFAWRWSFCPPTQREVSKVFEAAIFVDRMMKTGNHGRLAARHSITKELPCTIFDVM
jgi:hypothetical protein